MNETDWLAGLEPLAMLDHLDGKASDRKLRLFACACVRRHWNLLRYRSPREAVQLAERFAQGLVAVEQLEQMRPQAEASSFNAPEFERLAYQAAAATLADLAIEAARTVVDLLVRQKVLEAANEAISAIDEARLTAEASAVEHRQQGRLINEVFGNPFRPVPIDPGWLNWSNGIVACMVRRIDEEQRMEELPYLADALFDAGCDEDTLLRHLREPGDHVPGCWVVDALMGRTG